MSKMRKSKEGGNQIQNQRSERNWWKNQIPSEKTN
jgi:hypothetical protein